MALKVTTVYVSQEDLYYLKEKGINMSRLFRQAIKHIRKGEIEYIE